MVMNLKEVEIVEIAIIGAIVFGICFGISILMSWLDYLFNWPLIRILKFVQFEWWHWLTFRHFWTYIYATDLPAYLMYMAIFSGIIAAVFLFFYAGRDWE